MDYKVIIILLALLFLIILVYREVSTIKDNIYKNGSVLSLQYSKNNDQMMLKFRNDMDKYVSQIKGISSDNLQQLRKITLLNHQNVTRKSANHFTETDNSEFKTNVQYLSDSKVCELDPLLSAHDLSGNIADANHKIFIKKDPNQMSYYMSEDENKKSSLGNKRRVQTADVQATISECAERSSNQLKSVKNSSCTTTGSVSKIICDDYKCYRDIDNDVSPWREQETEQLIPIYVSQKPSSVINSIPLIHASAGNISHPAIPLNTIDSSLSGNDSNSSGETDYIENESNPPVTDYINYINGSISCNEPTESLDSSKNIKSLRISPVNTSNIPLDSIISIPQSKSNHTNLNISQKLENSIIEDDGYNSEPLIDKSVVLPISLTYKPNPKHKNEIEIDVFNVMTAMSDNKLLQSMSQSPVLKRVAEIIKTGNDIKLGDIYVNDETESNDSDIQILSREDMSKLKPPQSVDPDHSISDDTFNVHNGIERIDLTESVKKLLESSGLEKSTINRDCIHRDVLITGVGSIDNKVLHSDDKLNNCPSVDITVDVLPLTIPSIQISGSRTPMGLSSFSELVFDVSHKSKPSSLDKKGSHKKSHHSKSATHSVSLDCTELNVNTSVIAIDNDIVLTETNLNKVPINNSSDTITNLKSLDDYSFNDLKDIARKLNIPTTYKERNKTKQYKKEELFNNLKTFLNMV